MMTIYRRTLKCALACGYGAWTGGPRADGDGRRSPRVTKVTGRHGQRGGGAGGRRRMFDGGELRLVLLKLIADAAAPRLRPDPRDRGADRRRLCAEPGRRLSDAHHARRDGPDRGAAVRGRRRSASRSPTRGARISPRTRPRSRRCSRGWPRSAPSRERTDGAPIRRAMGNLRQVLPAPADARGRRRGYAARRRRDARRGRAEDRAARSERLGRTRADAVGEQVSPAACQALEPQAGGHLLGGRGPHRLSERRACWRCARTAKRSTSR